MQSVTETSAEEEPKKLSPREKFEQQKQNRAEEKKAAVVSTGFSPKETTEQIEQNLRENGEDLALWLFQETGLKSEDVGFSWGTDMLLSRILSWVEEAETEAEFVQTLKYFHQSDVLYEKCKAVVSDIYRKVHA